MTHIDAIVPYLFGRFDPRFDTTRLVPHSWVTEHVEKMGCKSSFMFSFCSAQVTFLVLGSDKVWSQKMIALLVAGRRKVQLEPRRSNTHWISISHRRGTYCRVSITLGHGAPTVGSTQFAVEHPPFVFVCFSSQQNNLGWRLCMFLFPDSLCWGIMAGHPILMLLTMRADMMDLSLPTVPMATLLHIPTILTPGLQAMALFTHRATPLWLPTCWLSAAWLPTTWVSASNLPSPWLCVSTPPAWWQSRAETARGKEAPRATQRRGDQAHLAGGLA
jgi:hypothetical protein